MYEKQTCAVVFNDVYWYCFFLHNTSAQSSDSNYLPKNYVEIKHTEWSKHATIYEVNIRQFTPEGTFKAFEKHLPRLKEMGVDILWLMPINPIGIKNRKGSLGSYYAVKDYYGLNAEFGTMDDFKNLVATIHAMGMHVVIDWIANLGLPRISEMIG